MTASLLRALGLPGLITVNPEEYARVGLSLLNRAADLLAVRSKLAANLGTTTTFDARGKCRELEAVYRQICRMDR